MPAYHIIQLEGSVRSFKVITDPEAFQLLADETRRRIIYLLRAKEMTVAQIAEQLKLTPQAIYHHIRKLKDIDMVEIAREKRVDHLIETYYRATAEVFNLTHGKSGGGKILKQQVSEALGALGRLGIGGSIEPSVVTRVVQIMQTMKGPESASSWAERIDALTDVGPFVKQELLEYTYLMTASEAEFERFLGRMRELRKTLRSTMPKPASPPKKA